MLTVFLIGLAAALVAFALVWAVSVCCKNYGFLDVAWSYSIALLAPFYALVGPGDGWRKWLAAGVGAAWSLRLGTYILWRVLKHHPREDPRYEQLRRDWPGPLRFFLFFELQAVIALVFSLPFLLASWQPAPHLHPLEIIGLLVALIALWGESLADAQMNRFKRDPAHRLAVCQIGLWRYSRHPNYFFEFLVWVGFFLFSLPSPWGWTTIICPFLIAWFLLRVTGIPLTERYALKSKGDAYRDYQRTTSPFIPWFRKAS